MDEILERLRISQDMGRRHYTEQRKALQEQFAVATVLRDSEELWLDFCALDEWATFKGTRPRSSNPDDALRHVLRFAVGWKDPEDTKRVGRFYNALQPLFAERTQPQKIAETIKERGGIEAMCAAAASARRVGRHPPAKPALKPFQVALPVGKSGKRFRKNLAAGRGIRGTLRLAPGKSDVVEIHDFYPVKPKTERNSARGPTL